MGPFPCPHFQPSLKVTEITAPANFGREFRESHLRNSTGHHQSGDVFSHVERRIGQYALVFLVLLFVHLHCSLVPILAQSFQRLAQFCVVRLLVAILDRPHQERRWQLCGFRTPHGRHELLLHISVRIMGTGGRTSIHSSHNFTAIHFLFLWL